ncbi:PTS sugar transporter subunit IIA [Microvirga aerophila]|uniref:PTS IIA-like nitrogen-regulatory protein PtsN n=1 Tax=Microvirga aerophila TaxID=670291 RepID=A0A512BP21_9HYPH|nr:PTS sugar transporter subunit IIA [Microvirga aerophila]GEO13691.1 PTS IIA-like nitrogen-regulatory protein PtsN [Microvirga aerophila]
MMASLVTPEHVISRLSARDVWRVVNELTRIAADSAALDHELVRDAVLERGKTSCFGLGRGVAIPHAAILGLEQAAGVFARLRPAQDFGAADNIPADLVFLLLSPGGDDPTHLRAMACVARCLRDHEVAARLRSAKDAEAIHIMLTSDTWRELGEKPETGHSATPHSCGLTIGSM